MITRDSINEVYPDTFVSDISFVRESDTGRFGTIVTVCQDHVGDNVGDGTDYHWFNLADGVVRRNGGGSMDYRLFERAARKVRIAIAGSGTTLVHCHAGVSRAPSVTAAAIGAIEDMSFYGVLARIEEHRHVSPHPNLRDHAKRFIEDRTDIEHQPFLD